MPLPGADSGVAAADGRSVEAGVAAAVADPPRSMLLVVVVVEGGSLRADVAGYLSAIACLPVVCLDWGLFSLFFLTLVAVSLMLSSLFFFADLDKDGCSHCCCSRCDGRGLFADRRVPNARLDLDGVR
jgi:hypothetical protein